MRIKKHLLPVCFPSHIKKGWGMVELDGRYDAMPKELLRVTAHTVSPVVLGDDQVIHLDALITTAVVNAHPCAVKFDNSHVFPAPLEVMWQDDQGYPMWAATDLAPVGDTANGREYWHKRYPVDKAPFGSKQNANTTAGRWREYRVPMQTVSCSRLEGACIGNREEITRLLEYITHIGKKGSAGYGRVAKWTVEPMEDDNPLALIAHNRTVPMPYALQHRIVGVRCRKGWRPPYWYAPHWTDCIQP